MLGITHRQYCYYWYLGRGVRGLFGVQAEASGRRDHGGEEDGLGGRMGVPLLR